MWIAIRINEKEENHEDQNTIVRSSCAVHHSCCGNDRSGSIGKRSAQSIQ